MDTPKLSHLAADGTARMVDVSQKPSVLREAIAVGFIRLQPATLALVEEKKIAKGEVLSVARIAGIQAAKHTANLIPLCHQLPLSRVSVDIEFRPDGLAISASAKTVGQTGVEMEALTAVSIAALTIYDMCKAVDKFMVIESIQLVSKSKGAPDVAVPQ